MPVEAFVEFLDDVLDDEIKKQVRTTLVRDKLLPDTSFTALAAGVLAKLGEKVAGEAGKEIAGEIVGKAAKPLTEKEIGFYGSTDRRCQGRNKEHNERGFSGMNHCLVACSQLRDTTFG